MLKCEGYMMFRGRATITPMNENPPYTVNGTWLYRPDTECWYVTPSKKYPWGASFGKDLVSDFHEIN